MALSQPDATHTLIQKFVNVSDCLESLFFGLYLYMYFYLFIFAHIVFHHTMHAAFFFFPQVAGLAVVCVVCFASRAFVALLTDIPVSTFLLGINLIYISPHI